LSLISNTQIVEVPLNAAALGNVQPIKQPRVSTPLPVEPDALPVRVLHILHKISLLGCVLLACLFLFYTPPDRYSYLVM
jgi:hypothetical protein